MLGRFLVLLTKAVEDFAVSVGAGGVLTATVVVLEASQSRGDELVDKLFGFLDELGVQSLLFLGLLVDQHSRGSLSTDGSRRDLGKSLKCSRRRKNHHEASCQRFSQTAQHNKKNHHEDTCQENYQY